MNQNLEAVKVNVKDQFKRSDKAGVGRISEHALATLTRQLVGNQISTDVIQALFKSFNGGSAPNGTIDYNDFIEWLYESLGPGNDVSGASSAQQGLEASQAPPSPQRPQNGSVIQPCATSAEPCRLFCSHQHTEEALKVRAQWLGCDEGGCEAESVKASTPPFNTRLEGVQLPRSTSGSCVELNIATFGVRLPRVS